MIKPIKKQNKKKPMMKKKGTHKMPDGTIMSGSTHTKRSKPIMKKMSKAIKRAPY